MAPNGQIQPQRFLAGFLLAVAVIGAVLIYLADRKEDEFTPDLRAFGELHSIYRSEGMQRFLTEKARLRTHTSRALSADNQTVQADAIGIALYLFPDMLPSDDLERDIAMEEWAPLTTAIERSPGTPESRLWFETLRANIWNYESPSRTTPYVSAHARQAIRIYQTLSAP
jgi:hypothetical protein